MSQRHRKRTISRKSLALEALIDLRATVIDQHDENMSNAAARSILRIGKKHGVRNRSYYGVSICRVCMEVLVPGRNSRVRIRAKSLKYTCLRCNAIRTRGPSFGGD